MGNRLATMDSDEEWLHVRMRRGRESTPGKISRKVFEDLFGGQSAGQSLTLAYVVNIDAIHEAIRASWPEAATSQSIIHWSCSRRTCLPRSKRTRPMQDSAVATNPARHRSLESDGCHESREAHSAAACTER